MNAADETRESAPESPIASLLNTLELVDTGARTSEDIFTGPSQWVPHLRVFGGQVMAQAVVAAMRTIDAERPIHSVHGYFLRPGDVTKPITFSVDRIHDGRSFATRRTQAYQDGVPILSMIASFQTREPGFEFQVAMPEGLADPESLPSAAEILGGIDHPAAQHWAHGRAFDLRHVDGPLYFEDPNRARVPHQALWVRAIDTLPDDANLHRAAIAYLSDYTILEPVMRQQGASWTRPGAKVASLDHAVWWHHDARVDEWLLYVQETTANGGGRGLSHGRLYTKEGTLVASVAQEGMVRIPGAATE
ncbi:acyl-CoA thioesterase [Humidisolicoccus flavus]|uniref:acyl-CoA thioesterase n=1 Tax=Humidisolicoccus flavus TaxID=3111414 RepID=UPI00324FDACB